ncbi:MAG: hypothetical protein WBH98_04600 [Bacteroidales bacterium]
MTTNELGTQMGNIAIKAFNFLYDNFSNSPEITDELKQKVKGEREKIFTEFIPLVKQCHTFGEEDVADIGQIMALTYMQGIDDAGTKLQKMASIVENIVHEGGDEAFMRDFMSLSVMFEFLEKPTEDDEERKAMLKHVGLLD